jgi:SAM-dependent methyltransferase
VSSVSQMVGPVGGDIANPDEAAESTRIVRRFYNQYPYPPPLTDLDAYRQTWLDPTRLHAEYHLTWPARPYREELEILIAGCGTAQAAKYALRQPAARVVGIDFSATSIEHTTELKRRYNLKNLDLYQLPIERVGELNQRFDLIVCTGVLHHLPDPDAGLRALRTVLRPDGALRLMVYATYGRTGIYMLQEYARRLGIGASDAEIQDLAAVLMELPAGHPLEHLLSTAPDFRRKSALADALLNPLDRAYTVPDLFILLARAEMAFGRWLRQAPYLPQCGAPASAPHAARLAALPPVEQYAAMELFRGTMVRHSLIAYRDDGEGSQLAFDDDDRWLTYVPLRLPHTRCIEEGAPAGAAAVLLNQSHSYPDLYLPINAHEKRLFDAIDGTRTIGAIVQGARATGSTRRSNRRARIFFERLWHYDQVVFALAS